MKPTVRKEGNRLVFELPQESIDEMNARLWWNLAAYGWRWIGYAIEQRAGRITWDKVIARMTAWPPVDD